MAETWVQTFRTNGTFTFTSPGGRFRFYVIGKGGNGKKGSGGVAGSGGAGGDGGGYAVHEVFMPAGETAEITINDGSTTLSCQSVQVLARSGEYGPGTASGGNVCNLTGKAGSPGQSGSSSGGIKPTYTGGAGGAGAASAGKYQSNGGAGGRGYGMSAGAPPDNTDTSIGGAGGGGVGGAGPGSAGGYGGTGATGGVVIEQVNSAPLAPGWLDVPDGILGGSATTVRWGEASDPDGNLAGYCLERSVDSGAWEERYRGAGRELTDQITMGWQTVQYRVKAYDSKNDESGYILSALRSVINNRPPSAPASIIVPGPVQGGSVITVSWGDASDPDGNLAGYVLERSVNGGAWEELYRGASKELTSGIVMGWNTVRFRVKAYDALGDESAYILTELLTVINNTPPTAPSSIQVPDSIYGGSTITVTHGASTDADNNISGYTLEQSVNGGAWTEISTDTAFSHNVPITFGWNTIQFRVRAFDSYGAVSEYTASPVISIINNRPPTISGEDRDLGALAEAFPRQTYVVDDADGGEVTVEVRLDGVLKNTFTAAPGAENPLEFTPEDWRKILNGPHTWTITAVDGLRAAATRTITFTKNVTTARFRVAAPFPADAMPEKCIMNFQGAHPDGSTITIEACNNGFDEAPAWEDITSKVLTGQKHFFSNTQKTAARWGIGVRVTLNRGSASGDCYVHSQRGNFA